MINEVWLTGRERRGAVIGISKTDTTVVTLPSVRKTFTSVDDKWSWAYVTDVPGSVNDRYIGQVSGPSFNNMFKVQL